MTLITKQADFESNRYNWEKTTLTWTWIRENDTILKKTWEDRGFKDYLDTGNVGNNITPAEYETLFKAYIHHTTQIARSINGEGDEKWETFTFEY